MGRFAPDYKNKDKELDWEYKKELIAINYMSVLYEDKKTELVLWITVIANLLQLLYSAIALLKFLSPKKKK